LAVDVEPDVSYLAASYACRTHIEPKPFYAGATLAVGATTAQAATRQRMSRRM
jgi:hypothetical protein